MCVHTGRTENERIMLMRIVSWEVTIHYILKLAWGGGPKTITNHLCLLGGVNLWNKCGWQESFRYKQCEAIKSSVPLGSERQQCVLGGNTVTLWGLPHAMSLNGIGYKQQRRRKRPEKGANPMISICSSDHPLVGGEAAPAIMLSQVMVRRRTRISYNSDGVQNTIYWEDTRTRESKRCQRINWGCSTRTNIVMTCFDHMFSVFFRLMYCKFYR